MESSTGGSTSILLWFATSRIADKQTAVISDQCVSQFILGVLIHILGVVSNDTLGDGRADSVDLRGDTTSLDSNTNVKVAELVLTDDKDGLEHLQAKSFRLNVLERLTIDFDQTATLLSMGDGCGSLFSAVENDETRVNDIIQSEP